MALYPGSKRSSMWQANITVPTQIRLYDKNINRNKWLAVCVLLKTLGRVVAKPQSVCTEPRKDTLIFILHGGMWGIEEGQSHGGSETSKSDLIRVQTAPANRWTLQIEDRKLRNQRTAPHDFIRLPNIINSWLTNDCRWTLSSTTGVCSWGPKLQTQFCAAKEM